MAKSPLIWFGGKAVYAKRIIYEMPPHRMYREAMVGGCNVISQKERVAHEVINDKDTNLINFLIMAGTDPEKFMDACERLPYSRFLYEKWKREPLPENEFERAVRWFYMNRSGISKGNAEEVSQTGWRHSNSSSQNPAQGYISACKRIPEFVERLKGVMVECMDCREFLVKYDDPEAVNYVDPPYVGREKYYSGGFTENDHIDLADTLKRLKGKVILSYYADPLIDELYADWRRESFAAYKQTIGKSGADVEAEEILLMNFSSNQMEFELIV